MPEVVEVCITGKYLNYKLLGNYMTEINILGGRYQRHGIKGLEYFKMGFPMEIINVETKGKFLYFELRNINDGNDYYILNTFGLEGKWDFYKNKHSNIEFIIYDINNNKNFSLYFTDSRNFGTIELTSDKNKLETKLNSLGPDFLNETFSGEEFYERIKKYITRGNKTRLKNEIVKILMNQTMNGGLGSGLGNYLTVEILFKAGISPYKTIGEIYMNKQIAYKLSKSIKYILKLAFLTSNIGYLSGLDNSFNKWITKMRNIIKKNNTIHPTIKLKNNDIFNFKVYRRKVDPYGNKINADKIINSRTTYWSPKKQN